MKKQKYEILYKDGDKPGTLIREAKDPLVLMTLLIGEMEYSDFLTIYKVTHL